MRVSIMVALNKLRKVSKKLHWGRGGNFLKHKGKGIKGVTFFTSSQRKENNNVRD